MRRWFALFAFGLGVLGPAGAVDAPQPPYRLTPDVRPTAARLDLTLDPNVERFSGEVEFDLDVRTAQPMLVLHARNLDISTAELRLGTGAPVSLTVVRFESKLGFQAPSAIPAGRAQLRIRYSGKVLGAETHGIFRQQDGGRWYLFSDFEAVNARLAFPCFDEPGFKHPWQLILHVPERLIAASNTPIASDTVTAAGRTVTFEVTPPLPSYLVAFAVGSFDVVEAGPAGAGRVPVRILTPHGRGSEAQYAATVMPSLVDFEERYLGVPYPYRKLDLVAVRNFGAMENPGLITFSDNTLLSLPKRDRQGRRRGFVSTAAHELAHHWFGDLVTTAWWNDVWLNEALATFMEPKALASEFPGWDGRDTYQRREALAEDSRSSARSIRQPVDNDSDIEAAFDDVTYLKGALVLEMFEASMGPEAFRAGLASYLRARANGNATVDDFLSALAGTQDPEIAPGFRTFLDQNGFPEVTAVLRCGRTGARLELKQRAYVALGSPSRPHQWRVPVCVAFGHGTERDRRCTWLTEATATLELEACPEWVLPNEGMAGYFRMQLPMADMERLLGAGWKHLTPRERQGVVEDLDGMVVAGELDYSRALAAVPQFGHDADARVVDAALTLTLGHVDLVDGQPTALGRLLRTGFGHWTRALGFVDRESDTQEESALRPYLLTKLGVEGQDTALQGEARKLSARWLRSPDSVPPSAMRTALRIAVGVGSEGLHQALVDRLKTEANPAQRILLVIGLGNARTPEAIRRAAELAPKQLESSEFALLMQWAGRFPSTRETAFQLVQQNLAAYRGQGMVPVDGRLIATASGLCSPEARARVEAFYRPQLDSLLGGRQALAETLESIDQCVALAAAQKAETQAWLAKTWGTTARGPLR